MGSHLKNKLMLLVTPPLCGCKAIKLQMECDGVDFAVTTCSNHVRCHEV
jgi:hypothetical protein